MNYQRQVPQVAQQQQSLDMAQQISSLQGMQQVSYPHQAQQFVGSNNMNQRYNVQGVPQHQPVQQSQMVQNHHQEQKTAPQIQNEGQQSRPPQQQVAGVYRQSKPQLTCEVDFNVRCDFTQPGDRLAIVGNIEALSEWDTRKPLYLETSPQSFPDWHLTLMLPRDLIIEYKYVTIQFAKPVLRSPKPMSMGSPASSYSKSEIIQNVIWEDFGNGHSNNRRLNTFDKKEIILQEEVNNRKVIEEFVEERSYGSGADKSGNSSAINVEGTPEKVEQKQMKQQNITAPSYPQNMASYQQPPAPPSQMYGVAAPPVATSMTSYAAPQTMMMPQQIPGGQNQAPNGVFGNQNNRNSQQVVEPKQLEMLRESFGLPLEALEEEKSDAQSTQRQIKSTPMQGIPMQQTRSQPVPPAGGTHRKMSEAKAQNLDLAAYDGNTEPFDKAEPVVIASYLLPFSVNRDKQTGELLIERCFHNPTLLYGTLENMMQKKQYNFYWVGLVTTLEDVSEQEKQELTEKFRKLNSYPIFMTAEEMAPYTMFFENVLRPLFHNFKDLYDMRNEYLQYWGAFNHVNQRVAQKIAEIRHEIQCKTVWIHNCQLIMVPFHLKKLYEQANIGFYFHQPFPSSAHFRIHKYRFEILKSLLSCDLVAFHLFMYARNFFKTCNRLLGYDLEFLKGGYFGVNFHGKVVMIRVSHIGVEETFIKELTETKDYKKFENIFRRDMQPIMVDLNERRVVGEGRPKEDARADFVKPLVMSSIDSYHPISGLKNKLLSYQRFLRQYPSFQHKVVFIQFVGSTVQAFDREEGNQRNIGLVQDLRTEVQRIVGEIQSEFGRGCLIFQESNPPLSKRLALWSSSDIILCSALKDGLCIQVLEYVVCRKLANKFNQSIMICSEFAGCNEAMRGVLKYNPFSLTGFSDAMDIAMQLTSQEKEQNMKYAYNYLIKNNVSRWTEEFLRDLKLAYKPVESSYYLGFNYNQKKQRGKKNNNRLMEVKPDFRRLNSDSCSASLLKSQKGVIFIEIDALPHLEFSSYNQIPTMEVIEQLYGLLVDNRNTVIILGNQNQETLEQWFGRRGPSGNNQFWLSAESGYTYKTKEGWQTFTEIYDFQWMPRVRQHMERYCDNIDGSFVEERQSCIRFNYKNAEAEHGTMFIHDLNRILRKATQGTNTEIIYGSGFIEVKPTEIKKHLLVELLLEKISRNRKIDYLFYLGHDSSDEPVYELLKSSKAKQQFFHPECSKYICVLEKKPSEAEFYIEDAEQVNVLLQKLQTATKKRKKIRSFADLTKLNVDDGPLTGQKLGRKKRNESIANLNTFMQSNIDINNTRNMLHPGGAAFIPRSPYTQLGEGKQQLSAGRNSINTPIEEECEEAASQSNLPLYQNPKKFGSVEDTNKETILQKGVDRKASDRQGAPNAVEQSQQHEGGQRETQREDLSAVFLASLSESGGELHHASGSQIQLDPRKQQFYSGQKLGESSAASGGFFDAQLSNKIVSQLIQQQTMHNRNGPDHTGANAGVANAKASQQSLSKYSMSDFVSGSGQNNHNTRPANYMPNGQQIDTNSAYPQALTSPKPLTEFAQDGERDLPVFGGMGGMSAHQLENPHLNRGRPQPLSAINMASSAANQQFVSNQIAHMDQMGDASSPSIRLGDSLSVMGKYQNKPNPNIPLTNDLLEAPYVASAFKPKVVIQSLAQAEELAKKQMSSNSSTPGIQKVKKLDLSSITDGQSSLHQTQKQPKTKKPSKLLEKMDSGERFDEDEIDLI